MRLPQVNWVRTEIGARNGVGTAAIRIRRNGLTIGKIHNDQQRNNGGADGNDVVDTGKSERDQETEGGFRTVRGRTEGVESENWNAASRADLFGAFVSGPDRFTDEEVEDIHVLDW